MALQLKMSRLFVFSLLTVATACGGSEGGDTGGASGSSGNAAGTSGNAAGAIGNVAGNSGNAGGSAGAANQDGGTAGSGTVDPTDPYSQARIDCVDRINAFRATEGKPPLARWTAAESCTDEQSEKDASPGGGAHANFGDCGEFAQNTCPGWGGLDQVIKGCLQSMWDEGPGEPFSEHGHYLNMSSTKYTMVSCGFYEMPNGDIWHNHNFK